jgi:type IV pilus assembly protein PilF
MHKTITTIIITVFLTLFLVACTTTGGEQKPVRKKSPPNLGDASEINVQLAVGYIQRKQYNSARDKLEKAIEQDPENVKAYKTLAYLYALLGLNDDAETKYNEALEINADDPELLNSYGAFLCTNGKFDEAQKKFEKAYSNPFYESLYLAQSNAGSCFIRQGEYKKAEALLRKSLRVQPKLPGSLISMADVGIKTERYLMARAYIQRYHAVKAPGPESLWIQIQAEKALGAHDHYMKYARQLINEFPDSDEAGWVEAQARNEQFRL